MPNFDAAEDELTYDFTKYIEGAAGVIPEPSSQQLEDFTETLRQVMPTKVDEATGKNVLDIDKLSAAVEAGEDLDAILCMAVEGLFSGTPSAEQISSLPFRVKQRFFGWVVGTFLSQGE